MAHRRRIAALAVLFAFAGGSCAAGPSGGAARSALPEWTGRGILPNAVRFEVEGGGSQRAEAVIVLNDGERVLLGRFTLSESRQGGRTTLVLPLPPRIAARVLASTHLEVRPLMGGRLTLLEAQLDHLE